MWEHSGEVRLTSAGECASECGGVLGEGESGDGRV